MDLKEFKESLKQTAPPGSLEPHLHALWIEAQGSWDQAHRIVQNIENRPAAWVHAYLHRKEGDPSNAAYWYSRAGREMSAASFEEEWDQIAAALLSG